MSATIINVDGTTTDIGHEPTLKEAQGIVGGFVEMSSLYRNGQLIFNEDGRRLQLEYNSSASTLAGRGIVGQAIHLTGKDKWK